MGPRDQTLISRSRMQHQTRCQNQHWTAEVAKVRGGSTAKDTTRNHCTDTILYPLLCQVCSIGRAFLFFYNAAMRMRITIKWLTLYLFLSSYLTLLLHIGEIPLDGLALDIGNGKLYYSDAGLSPKIVEMNLDGSRNVSIFSDSGMKPRALVLDKRNR